MSEGLEMQLLGNEERCIGDEEPQVYNKSARTILFKRYSRCPHVGIILATISSLFFSLCSVIVRWMKDVSPSELAIFRFIGVLLPSIPILVWESEEVFPKGKRIMLFLRSFAGATGLMLSFYAFRHMQLADASVIVFSVPVFVAIFARIFLKEPCSIFSIISVILTLVGVVLITRPSIFFNKTDDSDLENNADNETWGAVAAFGATLFGASAYVLLRALKSLHFAVVMTNFGTFALIQTIIVTWFTGGLTFPMFRSDRLLIIALAIFSFLGQVLLTLAFKVENAGPISVARTSDIVFAFIWQILFFQHVPNVFSIVGALYVIASVLLIAFRKWIVSLPNDDPRKSRLHFLTK